MNRIPPKHTVMQRDFKAALDTPARPARRHLHWALAAAGVVLLTTLGLLFTDNEAGATRTAPAALSGEPARITLPLDLPGGPAGDSDATPVSEPPAEPVAWHSETVRPGDSLARIFSRLGISARQLDRLMRTGGPEVAKLRRIMPGQTLRFDLHDGELRQLVYEMDRLNTLYVQLEGETFTSRTETRELETRITSASGTIDSSLFLAGMEAGLSDNLIMELAGIFGWDIDFALDIRKGDRFTLLYEEKYLDGEKLRDGNILAAEFTNRNKTYRALRYTDPGGRSDYYTPDGRSMRKAFIRTPVDFTRISSRFGSRYHPTLKKRKNHHGVDYAAPTGTPIKAAGDGKLVFVGRKGGYGKTVIIQHGGKYSTLYAHMSRIRPGMRRGKHVRQGQVIGYVGSTGRSTGPHLHYEFRVNGVHRNPLTVKLPDAAPIQASYRADFLAKTRVLLSRLDMLTGAAVAVNEHVE